MHRIQDGIYTIQNFDINKADKIGLKRYIKHKTKTTNRIN